MCKVGDDCDFGPLWGVPPISAKGFWQNYSPPHSYGHFFVSFVNVLLTLYYDYMCSETDFTQEKVNSHPTTVIPNLPHFRKITLQIFFLRKRL